MDVCPLGPLARRHRHRGFTLLELMLVLALIAGAAVPVTRWFQHQQDVRNARLLGTTLSNYNAAVARRLADEGPSFPSAVFDGVDWLRSSSDCAGGLAPAHYLPCDFRGVWRYGLTPRTTINNTGTSLTGTTVLLDAATLTATFPVVRGESSGVIAKVAVEAAGINITGGSYLLQTFEADLTLQQIEAVATTIGSTVDIFLRLDGSNEMAADLDVGGHQIVNVEDVVSDTGQRLGSVPLVGELGLGDSVTKWDCPPGLSPRLQIAGIPQNVPALATQPLASWQLRVVDTGTAFELDGQVVTAAGAITDPHILRVSVIGQCI